MTIKIFPTSRNRMKNAVQRFHFYTAGICKLIFSQYLPNRVPVNPWEKSSWQKATAQHHLENVVAHWEFELCFPHSLCNSLNISPHSFNSQLTVFKGKVVCKQNIVLFFSSSHFSVWRVAILVWTLKPYSFLKNAACIFVFKNEIFAVLWVNLTNCVINATSVASTVIHMEGGLYCWKMTGWIVAVLKQEGNIKNRLIQRI